MIVSLLAKLFSKSYGWWLWCRYGRWRRDPDTLKLIVLVWEIWWIGRLKGIWR